MLIALLKSIVLNLQKQIKTLFTLKKLCLIASVFIFYYRYKNLPSIISSYDFLNFLNSKDCNISSMEIFLNKFILFKTNNCDYFTGYAITNQENFTNMLL